MSPGPAHASARAKVSIKLIVALGLITCTVGSVYAETYRVTVNRIDKDLYRESRQQDPDRNEIRYERVTRDDAVLRWEGRSGTNWIVFSDGAKCDVAALR